MTEFDFMFAVVHPPTEGSTQPTWSFPADLTEESMADCKQYSHVSGIQKLGKLAPDVVQPHMFCLAGLTQYRTLCDILGLTFLGPNADAQALAENKGRSRLVMKAAGVPVADGEILIQGQNETPTIDLPYVVKPSCEGNS